MLAGDATPTILYGDVLQIEAVFDEGATDEYCNYEKDITNFSSNTYPYFLLRYKTSESANGAKAKVILGFTSGTQVILDESYSTTWKVASGTITADKTVDKVFFYAEDDGVNGTFYVYYDFLLLHKGIFNFPYVDDISLELENRYADIAIPGRVGDISQYLGSPSPVIKLSGKIDIGADSTWGEPPLEYLYRVWQEAHSDRWQWFSTGGLGDSDRIINCKVTLRKFPFIENKEATRAWSLELKHYSLSSGDEDTWGDLQWLGI